MATQFIEKLSGASFWSFLGNGYEIFFIFWLQFSSTAYSALKL
jgi:hypothetical protein